MYSSQPELSVVIPCLNEEDTIEICLKKIKKIFLEKKIHGEIIVVDNGCTDRSIDICKKYKKYVKVIKENKKGYGSALKKGIKNSTGKFVLIADADDSYNFLEIPKFLKKLRVGYDLVQGCRFSSGGGKIEKGAMAFTHRYFGNPFFSFIVRVLYRAPFKDVCCGMRAFDREKFLKLSHFSDGMEFAVENLLKFNGSNLKIAQVPITLHKDGREKTHNHLRTFSDGFRILKLLLVCCPRWIYFLPSLFFLTLGTHNILTLDFSNRNSFIIYKQITISSIFLILSLQISIMGFYAMTKSINLGFESKQIFFLKLFYSFFTFKKLLIICLLGIFFSIYQIYFPIFLIINHDINIIIFYFFFCFFVILLFNSILISFLEFDENNSFEKKFNSK
jgi:glycosyltransferase involved in cell wall biosynthesis